MKTIWKFPISASDVFVNVPSDAELLTVTIQNKHDIVLCAAVDTEKPNVARIIYGISTGGKMPSDAKKYLGTTQLPALALPGGVFVQHWYSTH